MQAAIKVLGQARKPMSCKEMIEAMAKKNLWTSPGGKTPEATLYSSILRDLKKGKDARFKKAAPGRFTLAK
ncbi:MAG: winged helix-turn-helix domain-containing protein [Pirellulaceae bacterium]